MGTKVKIIFASLVVASSMSLLCFGKSQPLIVVEKGQSNMVRFHQYGEEALTERMPYSVEFIPCAISGTSIGEWLPDGKLQAACSANALRTVDAMLFYQGETDAVMCTEDWFISFSKIVAYEKKIHPFIKIVYVQIAAVPMANPKCVRRIQAQQEDFIYGEDVKMVSARDLEHMPDGLHLTPEGERVLATRIACRLLYWNSAVNEKEVCFGQETKATKTSKVPLQVLPATTGLD